VRGRHLPVVPLVAALILAPVGIAHPTGTHTGFVSTVSGIHPAQPGLIVSVFGGHERLSVRNFTRETVVLFGPNGDPVLRLEPGAARAIADPRIGSSGPPPDKGEFVKDWRIAGTANGERFEIVGFLGYRPSAGATVSKDDGLSAWAIAVAVVAGTLVLGAALALPLWLRKGEDARLESTTERSD
jgi:hypothetical protein